MTKEENVTVAGEANLMNALRLSFYQKKAVLNEKHGVFLVQHVESGKVFVQKTLLQYDPAIYRTLQEKRLPGIPLIEECIEQEEGLVVIEEYIAGDTLEARLAEGPLSKEEASRILRALCEILEPLHQHRPPIVHRDIKASNVLLDERGQVFLIDFDASKQLKEDQTRDTVLMGTEEYAAPEQYGFAPSDARTDIYALGVLFNLLLTGHFPQEGISESPFAGVIRRCTQMDPAKRFASVQQLGAALDEVRKERTTAKRALRSLPGIRSGKRWRMVLWGIAFLFYLWLCASAEFRNVQDGTPYRGVELWCIRVAAFLLFFLPAMYLADYLGWRKVFPWHRQEGKAFLEAIRVLLGVAILACAPILLMALLWTIIEPAVL